MTHFIRPITPSDLLPRRVKSQIDETPIHIGDTVVLRPANGPDIRATVIYNAPINGTVTYTTDVVGCGRADQPGMRIRFRHEHVHRIESVRHGAN